MPPTIVIIHGGFYQSFDQLAVGLRRAGVRVVAVRDVNQPIVRLRGRLLFDDNVIVPAYTADALRPTLERLGDSIVDVISPEMELDAVIAAGEDVLRPDLLEHLRWRQRWAAKWEAGRVLREQGIRTPEELPLPVGDDADFSPCIVKARIGLGGIGVRVARTPEEANAAAAELSASGKVYAERLMPGTPLCYCAAWGPEGITHEAAYARADTDGDSLGPAPAVRTLGDERLLEVGRAAIAALGGRGVANIEMMDDGELAVIDVNVRPWHSIVALDQAGVDFTDGYLRSLGLAGTGDAASQRSRPDVLVPVFPQSALAPGRRGGPIAALARDGWSQRRTLGPSLIGTDVLWTLRHLQQTRSAGATAD
ncbi:MAG: hypothetical protein LWW86_08870 [Micrococcales bacterium]|nr:hypothetical protein [Micrococcales bacterium]